MSLLRLVVTGATGFLGGHCVRDLTDRYEVVAVGRQISKLRAFAGSGIETANIELSHPTAAEQLLDLAPDVIVHAAALSAPWGSRDDFESANVAATAAVLRAAEETDCKLVHVSTPTIYMDGCDTFMISEDAELPSHFINDYASTKYEAEQRVACSTVHASILRPQAIVGAGDTTVAPRFLRVIERGLLPLVRGHNPTIDMTHVTNVVQAIELSIQQLVAEAWTGSEVFNVTNGDPRLLSELLDVFLAARSDALLPADPPGGAVRKIQVPRKLLEALATLSEQVAKRVEREPALTQYAVELLATSRTLNISKARSMLGYDPSACTLEQAFADYFEHGS